MRHRISRFEQYETHWREWGERGRPVVILLHGYTQNGAAFQAFAEALSATYRVVAPDALGRGYSSWADRGGSYSLRVIAAQMEDLIEDFDEEQVRWVGTSMGGIVGLLVARIALDECLSTLQWAGSAVIIVGLLIFNLGFDPVRRLFTASRPAGT